MARVSDTARVGVPDDTLEGAPAAPERTYTAALDVVVRYLRMVCAWPEGRGKLARAFSYVLPYSFASSGVPQLVYFALGEHDDNVELVGFLADALGSSLCCFKMFQLQKHAVTIMAVREILEGFTPMERSVAAQAELLNERCERRSVTILRRYVRAYSVLSALTVVFMVLAVIRNDPWYSVKAPRYMMETRPLYIAMVVLATTALYAFPVAIGLYDGMIFTLSLHTACKCDVLALVLQQAVRQDADEIGLQDGDEERKRLRLCAIYHQQIIRLHRASESIFCTVALCQMFYTLFGLGTPLFRMLNKTQEVVPQDIAFSAVYVVWTFTQLFTFCYSGDLVAKASARLSSSTYSSFHPSLSGKDTRLGLIQHMIVLRAQRPLFLTAGRFTNLTLQLFQDIMRRSYSLYSTVLNVR
ncbi:odorant receptor Or2-like [Frankliniella occidentalis]|uniref:Odorant receptor n=1 Tax=Frankliniella occidentalis TaxID=133901 RepID=A0A9C6U2B1_FRAOC|nr:odorant receptor Or2-like [Frankliniella occidentalis]